MHDTLSYLIYAVSSLIHLPINLHVSWYSLAIRLSDQMHSLIYPSMKYAPSAKKICDIIKQKYLVNNASYEIVC
jgi:hypothetical protein